MISLRECGNSCFPRKNSSEPGEILHFDWIDAVCQRIQGTKIFRRKIKTISTFRPALFFDAAIRNFHCACVVANFYMSSFYETFDNHPENRQPSSADRPDGNLTPRLKHSHKNPVTFGVCREMVLRTVPKLEPLVQQPLQQMKQMSPLVRWNSFISNRDPYLSKLSVKMIHLL